MPRGRFEDAARTRGPYTWADMAMLFNARSASGGSHAPDWDDVQGDIPVGLPKSAQSFVFLEIVNVQAFKSTLRRSIAHRATSARAAREWSERHAARNAGIPFLGLNVGFTATGCAKLLDSGPSDPAFLAGAADRAGALGDAEPATNWLPQFLAAPIDAIVLIAGSSLKAVDAEWKMLANLLGDSVRLSYRESAAARPGDLRGVDHFGLPVGTAGATFEQLGLCFRDERAAIDAAPLPWMKNGSYLVFRRIEQLVPEYEEFAKSRPVLRGIDAAVWRAARLARRGISYGPEVSELERREGKTSADRGLMFVSYQTSIAAQFERVQRTCISPNRFAINSAAAYAFVPSISALSSELGG